MNENGKIESGTDKENIPIRMEIPMNENGRSEYGIEKLQLVIYR